MRDESLREERNHQGGGVKSLFERWADKILVGDDCWEWTACKTQFGYGRIANGGGSYLLAHRAAYQLLIGDIPDSKFICHHCDNPGCVNPSHLFVGDQESNMRDRDLKMRLPDNKLGRDGVLKARKMLADEVKQTTIAKELGVSDAAISCLKSGRTWSWLT